MKTNAKTVATEAKKARSIQISLQVENETTFQKLTQTNSAMPSWVLGEEIVKRLDKRRRNIEINLTDLFFTHQV